MTESKSELHFVRIREKDSKEPFCDPYADIKFVVTSFFKELPQLYGIKLQPAEDKIDYLKACLKVFLTRLEEDPQPVKAQLEAFIAAMQKAFTPAEILFFGEEFLSYVFCTFVLHYRRDAKVDKPTTMRLASLLLTLSGSVPADIWAHMMNGTQEDLKAKLECAAAHLEEVRAECVEDASKSIPDIKDLAAQAMGATGSQKWEDVAAACDKYVQEAAEDDDKVIAAALAYPDYPTPYFEVTKDA